MDFIPEIINNYCLEHTEPESELLKELNRKTHLQVLSPRMLSGHLQGRFLSFLSQLVQPNAILEIGTYTGYSALCLAEGLSENGTLITIDPSPETNLFASDFFKRSAYKNKITLMEGSAVELIPQLKQTFDLVFIDADKKNYPVYLQLVLPKVRKGGLIIADNVLWSGKITGTPETMDRETKVLHDFNETVHRDLRLRHMLLPLRDGLMVMIKN
jgi:predicted O-methyltransferase YrrM